MQIRSANGRLGDPDDGRNRGTPVLSWVFLLRSWVVAVPSPHLAPCLAVARNDPL